MSEFLAMGGYGWYVWMSYGACLAAIAGAIIYRDLSVRGWKTITE